MIKLNFFNFTSQANSITPSENSKDHSSENYELELDGFPYIAFKKADQILFQSVKCGICDRFGKGSDEVLKQPIPAVPWDLSCVERTVQKINEAFDRIRKIPLVIDPKVIPKHNFSRTIQEDLFGLWKYEGIQINYRDLLHHIYCYVHKVNAERLKKHLPLIELREIYWHGSTALSNLDIECLEYIAHKVFSGKASHETIKQWASAPHISHIMQTRGNDYDLVSQFSEDNIALAGDMSDALLKYLSLLISPDEVSSFAYYFRTVLDSSYTTQESFILYGGIENRKLLSLPETRFSILSLKTEGKTTELKFVGSKINGEPTLKNPCISSIYGFKAPLLQLLLKNKQDPSGFKAFENPFGSQAVLDVFLNNFNPAMHDFESLRHFLRRSIRMLDPSHERKMVEHVLQNKIDFLAEINLDKVGFSEEDAQSMEGYIFLVLRTYFSKIEEDCLNLSEDPYCVSTFIFQACHFLERNPEFSNFDYMRLWHYVNDYFWRPKNIQYSASTINSEIKKALIDEKIPYEVLTAWIELHVWMWDPYSITTHSGGFIFDSESFRCFLPIRPIANSLRLNGYLSRHALSPALLNIYRLISQIQQKIILKGDPSVIETFPAHSFFVTLKINLNDFTRIIENWMEHPLSELNTMGLQLHLSTSGILSQFSAVYIVRNLHRLISGVIHREQLIALICALDKVFAVQAPLYLPLTSKLKDENFLFSLSNWIKILIETYQAELVLIAYSLWRENKPQLKGEEKIELERYFLKSFSNINVPFSLYFQFKHVQSKEILSIFLKRIDSYLIPYQNKKIEASLDEFIPLLECSLSLIEQYGFENLDQKKVFSQAFKVVIHLIFSYSAYEEKGDDILLKASVTGYLEPLDCEEAWINRIKQFMQSSCREKLLSAWAYYLFASKSKWIFSVDRIKKEFSELSKSVKQAFSEENVFINEMEINKESKEPLYETFTYLFKKITFHFFNETHLEILKSLIIISSPINYLQTYQLLNTLFEDLFLSSFFDENQAAVPNCHLWMTLDKLVISKKIQAILEAYGKELEPQTINKLFLFEYLKRTSGFELTLRTENLWKILSFLLNTFPVNSDVLKQLIFLLSRSSIIPEQILEWVNVNGEKILSILLQNEEFDAIKVFLFKLNEAENFPLRSRAYVWELCKSECKKGKVTHETLQLFQKEKFELLKEVIQPEDCPYLLFLLTHLFESDKEQATPIGLWMEWCFNLHEKYIETTKFISLFYLANQCINRLVESSHLSEAIQLISRIPCENESQEEEILNLWVSTTEKFFIHAPIEKIIKLFTSNAVSLYVLKRGREIAPLMESVLLKFLGFENLAENEYKIILDLIECVRLENEEIWDALWKKIKKDHRKKNLRKIISDCWEIYKGRLYNLKSYPECILNAFFCLMDIAHADLVFLLENKKWMELFKKKDRLLVWEALNLIFLGIIRGMDLENFNFDSVKKLMNQKDILIQAVLENRNKKNTKTVSKKDLIIIQEKERIPKWLIEWNNKIENELINKLQPQKDPLILKAFCHVLNSIYQQLDSLFFLRLEVALSNFLTLSNNECDENNSCEIHESLIKIFQKVCSQSSFIPIVNLQKLILPFSTNSSKLSHHHLVLRLIPSVIKRDRTKAQAIKTLFLQMTENLWELNLSEWLPEGRDILKEISNQIKLTSEELSRVAFLFFKYDFQQVVDEKMKQGQLMDEKFDPLIDRLFELFEEMFLKLLPNLNLLEEIVEMISDVIGIYADKDNSQGMRPERFEHCLINVLEIFLRSSTSPPSMEGKYIQLVLKSVYHTALDKKIFIDALKKYGGFLLGLFKHQKRTNEQLINWIEEVIYFFPPVPLSKNPVGSIGDLADSIHLHDLNMRIFIADAYNAGVFFNYPLKLASLEIWTERIFLHKFPLDEFTPDNFQMVFPLIERLLSFNPSTPHTISRAQTLLFQVWGRFVPVENFNKMLRTYYLRIVNLIEENTLKDLCLYSDLFFDFLNTTIVILKQMPNVRGKHYYDIYRLNFPFLFKKASHLPQTPLEGKYKIYYLALYLNSLMDLYRMGDLNSERKQIFNKIEQLLPIIRYSAFIPFQKGMYIRNFNCSPHSFIISFINLVFLQGREDEFTGKVKLLDKWLEGLLDIQKDEDPKLLCDFFLTSLIPLFELGKEEAFFASKEKNIIPKIERLQLKYNQWASPSQKTLLELLLFKSKVNILPQSTEAYYKKLLEIVLALPNLTPGYDSLAILKVTSLVLFLSKNNDSSLTEWETSLKTFFLMHMKKVIESRPNKLDQNAKNFLAFFVANSLVKGWITLAYLQAIQWIIPYLEEMTHEPVIKLIVLYFGVIKCENMTSDICQKFVEEIKELIPHLAWYIIQTKQLYFANRMVEMITNLPISLSAKCNLLLSWYYNFEQIKIPDSAIPVIREHCQLLLGVVSLMDESIGMRQIELCSEKAVALMPKEYATFEKSSWCGLFLNCMFDE